MRNFFAAIALVIFGSVTNLQFKQGGSAPTTPSVVAPAVTGKEGNLRPPEADPFPLKYACVVSGKSRTRVLIATVPDPKLTRLSLHFDRWIESLQRAGEASGYALKSHWIPWTTMRPEYVEPGVLFFAGQSESLMILLVGESPVAGISSGQFAGALKRAGKCPVEGVIGPAFSGGFESLAVLLKDRKDLKTFPIVSGSATDSEATCVFENRFRYHSAVDLDDVANSALTAYLGTRRVGLSKSAVLAEGDTTYGAGDSNQSIRVTFPRDLSVLRRAYESDQQLSKSISQASNNAMTGASISLNRSEENAGRDSVSTQAAVATAATQELAMQSVAARLREDRVALATILATNTLDILFLRQYMAARVPDMQFVLFEPDLLFSHVPEMYSFQGTLAVSRYPLRLAPNATRYIAFPSKSAEGVYWAARTMLSPSSKVEVPKDLFLTMIGLDGYWPVANLSQSDGKLNEIRPPKTYLGICAFFVAAILFALCAISKGLQIKPTDAPKKWFADYHFDPQAPIAYARAHHAYCLMLGLVALFMLVARPLEEAWGKWVYLPNIFSLLLLACTLHWHKKTPRSAHDHWLDANITRLQSRITPWLTLFITLLILAFVGLLYDSVWKDRNWTHYAAYRSMYLANGVNPTLPLLFAGLSILVCAWYHFQRMIFASERHVPLDLIGFGTLAGPYRRVRDILGSYATVPAFISSLVGPALVLLVCWGYGSALTIEGAVYDRYVICLFAVSAAFTFLSVCQFLQAWWHFSDFLRGLEAIPVRHTFSKLPTGMGSVALFKSSPGQRSYVYLLRARDCMRKLQSLLPVSDPLRLTPDKVRAVENSLDKLLMRAGKAERETAEEAMNAQLSLMEVHTYLLWMLQERYWKKGDSDTLFDAKTLDAKAEKDQGRVYAEEFVAMRLLGFIRYVILQLRNLLTLFSVSFILQTMAVSCYPFFSQSLSQMYIGVAFTILSISIGYVLVKMSRDPILIRLATNPDSGAKDSPILQQALQSASLPLLAFASTYFPELGRALFSWVGPLSSAAK